MRILYYSWYLETYKNIKKKLGIFQTTWLFWKCIWSKGHICWWIHLSGSCSSHSGMADFKRKGTTSPDTYLLPTLDPIRAYIAICHWISSYILYLQHPLSSLSLGEFQTKRLLWSPNASLTGLAVIFDNIGSNRIYPCLGVITLQQNDCVVHFHLTHCNALLTSCWR